MIVADASWVVALRDPGDRHHDQALAINRDIGSEDAFLHTVTLAECLVAPARLGVLEAASEALRSSFVIANVDDGGPERWAVLRSESGLRLPDAIVLDTALSHGARAVATFDARLAAVSFQRGLEVLG
ncbi:MAG: PIN domain-containing protein [bacterium]|nr:PIN domain-containing protein [bacterium]MDE0216736.1 PIN domain-containing protein [bacterium]